jgi:hypothetical protein
MKLPTAAVTTHTLFRSSEFFECDWLVPCESHLPPATCHLPPAGGLLLLLLLLLLGFTSSPSCAMPSSSWSSSSSSAAAAQVELSIGFKSALGRKVSLSSRNRRFVAAVVVGNALAAA